MKRVSGRTWASDADQPVAGGMLWLPVNSPALALGAKAVLVGRAYLYGLAAAGEPGVRHAIDILLDELRRAMALCGARSIADIEPGMVRRRRGSDVR